MRALIERHGGIATIAPSMRELPLEESTHAFQFAEALFAGGVDILVFMTGVGARALLEAVQTRFPRDDFFAALEKCCTIVRGPKPTAVLREWGVHIDRRAPEPNTWRELLAVLEDADCIAGKTVAVQEYGVPNEEFNAGLVQRGARLRRLAIYRWALPEDTQPLEDAIRTTIAGGNDVLLFTSAQQLHNVLQVAESAGLKREWLAAANRVVVGSIGPAMSDALRSAGLTADVEASPTKMGQLVKQTLAEAPGILERKRS
jgi:uroporphyrinogen-III synthase